MDPAIVDTLRVRTSDASPVDPSAIQEGGLRPPTPPPELLFERHDLPDRPVIPALFNTTEIAVRPPRETTAHPLPGSQPDVHAAALDVVPRFGHHNVPLRIILLSVVVIGGALVAYLAYRFPLDAGARANSAEVVRHDEDSAAIHASPLVSSIEASAVTPVLPTPGVTSASAEIETTEPINRREADSEESATIAVTPAPASDQSADATSNTVSMPSVISESVQTQQSKAQSRAPARLSHSRGVAAPSPTVRISRGSPDAARSLVAPPSSGGREDKAADRDTVRVCTPEVAALALCNPRTDREGT